MKISGYKILGTLLFLGIVYGLCYLTILIWNYEDHTVRLCYGFYFCLIPLIESIDIEFPELFRVVKVLFKYIHNLMKKEYRL